MVETIPLVRILDAYRSRENPVYVQSTMAKLLLSKCKNNMDDKIVRFLETVARCNDSLKTKITLIRYPGMTTGIKMCDFETKIKIISGNY